MLSYAALAERVSRRAGYFRNKGVQPGDVVGLSSLRNLGWVIDLFAIGWCEATAALLPPTLTPEERNARTSSQEIRPQIG